MNLYLFLIHLLGNNLYGTSLHDLLSKLVNTSERNAYVLMDRINSPSLHNGVLKCGESKATECQLISEMGIHGVFIRYYIQRERA